MRRGSWLSMMCGLAACSGEPAPPVPEGVAPPEEAPAEEPVADWSLPAREVSDLALGRTHVVVIIVDTLRADHLGAWGYEVPTSPNLDALAAGGVRFANTFAASSWTRPGMAALTTGRYPREVGIYEERFDQLPEEATLLSERLQAAGYHTLGSTSNPNINSWFGFSQGFDEWQDAGVLFKVMRKREGFERFKGADSLESADEVTNRALALVDSHKDTLQDKPLYLQTLYIDPHIPYAPPDADKRRMEAQGSKKPEYDGEILDADREIKRLLDGLQARGILQDALVIVTSDHGEGLHSHPGQKKSQTHGYYLYDSMVHVPLIVSHPVLPAGTVVEDLTSQVDIVPTLFDLLGAPLAADEVSGRSNAAPARGEADPNPREAVYMETDWRWVNKDAVRTATHKLVRNHDAQVFQNDGVFEGKAEDLDKSARAVLGKLPHRELYPVADPMRETARQRSEELAPMNALETMLEGWTESHGRRPPLGHDPDDVVTLGDGTEVPISGEAGGKVDLDAETTAQLQALGYMDN